jgi:flagellar biosynthesis/type III secretory pathway chaperone
MDCKHILLSLLTIPITFASYGHATNEQRIQELKDVWYQKAKKLEELGKMIDEKNEAIITIKTNIEEIIKQKLENYDEDYKITFGKTYKIAVHNFYKRIFQAIQSTVNTKGFLMRELLNNKEEFFKDLNEDSNVQNSCSGTVDGVKLALIHIVIVSSIIKKLLEDYENCLQEMAAIDLEFVRLGHSPLFQD